MSKQCYLTPQETEMAPLMNLPYLSSSLPLNAFIHIFCFSPPEILHLSPRLLIQLASEFIFMPLTFQGLASVLAYPSILSRGGSKIVNSKSQYHKLAPGNYVLIVNKLTFYTLSCSQNFLISLRKNNV